MKGSIKINGEQISELKVLESPAGYYVGRTTADGLPYSRQTGYFLTREEAVDALAAYPDSRRTCFENKMLDRRDII